MRFTDPDGYDEIVVDVEVLPVNDPPEALAQDLLTYVDVSRKVTLTGYDVENDDLAFSLASGPRHGRLEGTPPDLEYFPDQGYSGEDLFEFKAYDGRLESPPATIRIEVAQGDGFPYEVAVAAGFEHTAALRQDGFVWTWGDNSCGQLGDSSGTNAVSPVRVQELSKITALAAEYYHTAALKEDGTVWTWGCNNEGQLGDGTNTVRTTPVQVQGVRDVAAIACGAYHTIVAKADGTVWAWGDNQYGQLGGDQEDRTTPAMVSGLLGIREVEGGFAHSLALGADGTVWSWGCNDKGQLGRSSYTTVKTEPGRLWDLADIVEIDCFHSHCLARDGDGKVWGWGCNDFGQLGDYTTNDEFFPTVFAAASMNEMSISCGAGHSAFIDGQGHVWTCGYNFHGQLGDGSQDDRHWKEEIADFSDAMAVACGANHTVVAKTDGSVWTWGKSDSGQLGVGASGNNTEYTLPTQLFGLPWAYQIAGGGKHTLALLGYHNVWAWGANRSHCQLGYGTEPSGAPKPDSAIPVFPTGLDDPEHIAAGTNHSLAWDDFGSAWAWGANDSGQLGDGETYEKACEPVRIADIDSLKGMAAGGFHSVALNFDGNLMAWGQNTCGQLGIGTWADRALPEQVHGIRGVRTVAAGYAHTAAVKNDGTVWAWGDNQAGQVEQGKAAKCNWPLQIKSLDGITSVACGMRHTVALKKDDTVWAWGSNEYGQAGAPEEKQKTLPIRVQGLKNIKDVDCGNHHTIALDRNGFVWALGRNDCGQLGDGTVEDRFSPVRLQGIDNVVAISCGGEHTVAKKADGTLWAWGNNDHGQVGDALYFLPTRTIGSVAGRFFNLYSVLDFAASQLEGPAPLSVQFTDLSSDNPSEWQWDFDNDGAFDAVFQDPFVTFSVEGTYTVSLRVKNDFMEEVVVKPDYIRVLPRETGLVKVGYDTYFESLWDAFLSGNLQDGDKLKLVAVNFEEILSMDLPGKVVRVEGGYDGDFFENPGTTTVNGIEVKGGTLVIDGKIEAAR